MWLVIIDRGKLSPNQKAGRNLALGVLPHCAMGRTGHTDMKMLSQYSHGDFDEVYEDNFGFLKQE